MSKAKPCPRLANDPMGDAPLESHVCGREKMKGKQSCVWHWLLRQSSDVQAAAMMRRRAAFDQSGVEKRSRVPAAECPEGERWCAGCQSMVPKFYCTSSRCKACASWASHSARLVKTYGIDEVEYERIFRLQGGRCAICRNKPASIRFAVDHDHATEEVRGILCKRCNHDLLGAAHDSVEMLWRALTYLLFPPAQEPSAQPRLPGEVVLALRAHLERAAAEARPKLPEALPPPF